MEDYQTGRYESRVHHLLFSIVSFSLFALICHSPSCALVFTQNIRHKSRDHGSATLQMETLQVTLTLDPVTYRSIELELKPTQDYTWMPPELECLTKFFKTQVRGNLVAVKYSGSRLRHPPVNRL